MKKELELNIVDAGCGVGKTTAMINFINQSSDEDRFIYITPLLTEVSRIKTECKQKHFKEPEIKPTKTDSIVKLIEDGENIVSTHALFKKLTEETLELSKFKGYTLIIDECADVIKEIEISKDDLKTVLEKYTVTTKDDNLAWVATEYEGRFEDYKNMIEMGGVQVYRSSLGEIVSLVWVFPISMFEAFDNVYLLTYMFNGQKGYYDYHNVKIKNLYVKDFQLTTEPQHYNYEEQKNLITILDDDKLNAIGDGNGSISKSWFYRNRNNILITQLKNNVTNFFIHKIKVPQKERLWTTFKGYKNKIEGKGYIRNFAPSNARATNDYRECTTVVYAVNKYMRPCLKHFFESHGITVDEKQYALSEMLQFIYRSAIRDNKPITVYVPSKRMRDLLIEWKNKKDE